MIKKILIPTDGYGLEDHVIKYVARAFPFASFYLISVINTYERGVQLTDMLYQEMKDSAIKAIERGEEILKSEGIDFVQSEILEGLPSRRIVKYAKSRDIDLIAMRVYCRKSTASAHRLGSTLKNVLMRSSIPVLTLAEECDRIPIKRVLLLTDATSKSKRAENYAILFSSSFKASLEIMYLHSDHEDATAKLKNVAWKASYWGIEVRTSTENIQDFEAIKKHFLSNDLIVMGLGKKKLFGAKIGHLSQFVATHAPIPVIFVTSLKKRWFQRTQLRLLR